MKKKRNGLFPLREKWKKNVLRMKFVVLLLLSIAIQSMASVDAQNFSMKKKNVSLEEIIWELKEKTQLVFLYSDEDVSAVKGISIAVKDVPIDEILTHCLKESGLEYQKINNAIIIRKSSAVIQEPQIKTIKISGKVTDSQKMPLPGVAVLIEGTTLGTTTNPEGDYTLECPETPNLTLIFSYIGMKTHREVVGKRTEINVVLEEEVQEMDEMVVTGIFTKAKESYTGSVTTISAKELKRVGNRNVLASIRNIDPSFNILDNAEIGSDPNRLPDITVRGAASLNVSMDDLQTDASSRLSANLPLFVLDGFEISLERMMDLNEDEVESITLLKDASATAMYGTRGANGVVVITSRKPELGKVRLTYNGSLSIEAPDLTSYNLMTAREKLAFEKAAGLYSNGWYTTDKQGGLPEKYNQRKIDVERGVDTYWLKYPVRTGVGQKHSLRIEGGDQYYRYSASLSYNDIAGAMKGSNRKTFNGNMLFAIQIGNLNIQNNLLITSNKAENSPYGTFSEYGKINSYYSPYDEQGNLKKILENFSYYGISGKTSNYLSDNIKNPLYNAYLPSKDESKYSQIQNNFSVDWKVIPELTVRGRFSITSQKNRSDNYKCADHTQFEGYKGEDYARRGRYVYGTGEALKYEGDITVNYSKLMNEVHSLYVGFGYNFAESKSENYVLTAEGISNINMDFLGMANSYLKNGSPSAVEEFSRRMGGIANVNYTYDRRYFMDFSAKIDGSSKFGTDNRLAPFWSIGMGWNMHRESFWKNKNWLNVARLKLSYGVTGSQNFYVYQAMTTFKDKQGVNYQGWYGSEMIGLGNDELGWQSTKQWNLGLELEFLEGRIRLNTDLYSKLTDDLLSDITLPSSSGFNSYKANVGQVSNKGLEVSLNAYIIRDTERSLVWLIGGSLMHNKNEIKRISNSLKTLNEQLLSSSGVNPSFLYEEGQSMSTLFAVPSKGIDPSTGKEIFIKRDGTETTIWDANDKVPCGINEPKIWGNLNTMLRYKGFTFNAVFGYRYGGQMYNSTLVNKVENITPNENADKRAYYDRWKVPGDHVFFKGVSDYSVTNATSRFIMDENTLECRSISLGYEWQSVWLKQLGLSYLALTGYMEDVFRISSIKQERGLSYPFSRKFSMTLSVRF